MRNWNLQIGLNLQTEWDLQTWWNNWEITNQRDRSNSKINDLLFAKKNQEALYKLSKDIEDSNMSDEEKSEVIRELEKLYNIWINLDAYQLVDWKIIVKEIWYQTLEDKLEKTLTKIELSDDEKQEIIFAFSMLKNNFSKEIIILYLENSETLNKENILTEIWFSWLIVQEIQKDSLDDSLKWVTEQRLKYIKEHLWKAPTELYNILLSLGYKYIW